MKKIKREVDYKSLLYPDRLYAGIDQTLNTLLSERTLQIQNIHTQQNYMAMRINTPLNALTNDFFKSKWRLSIENPNFQHFVWPVDLVMLNSPKPICCLVFKIVPSKGFHSLSEISQRPHTLGLENELARKIALGLIEAQHFIEEKKYLFFGIDDDNIMVRDGGDELLILTHEFLLPDNQLEIYFTEKEYFSELLDPFHYHNAESIANGRNIYKFDALSEYIAFLSLLFRLLIGIYPFEGPYMAEYEYNTSSADNVNWITRYLQNPVFVFDLQDKSNSLTMLNKYQINCERWDKLGNNLQTMFLDTFGSDGIVRRVDTEHRYTAQEWQHAIEELFFKEDIRHYVTTVQES